MRQYTNKEQTYHLVELGFPRPDTISEVNYYDEAYTTETEFEYAYSIGELIEFLGQNLMEIRTYPYKTTYGVMFGQEPDSLAWKVIQGELIDKLYDACVELKNEGVI